MRRGERVSRVEKEKKCRKREGKAQEWIAPWWINLTFWSHRETILV